MAAAACLATSPAAFAQALAGESVAATASEPAPAAAPAAFAKRYYLLNDDHTDYMWSADADSYGRVFVEQLDRQLALTDATQPRPLAWRAKFATDGSHWLWEYERRKTPAEFERLLQRVRDGSITVPLNALVSTYGAQPLEAVLRGMYYAGRLERRHGLRLRAANATENQTLPLGLASLFAGAGAPYGWRGVCACASQIPLAALQERPAEVYWYTGHDGQRQLMKWYSVGPHNVGTYWEAGEPEQALRWVQTDAGFLRRHVVPGTRQPYSVVGLFGFGGDDLARRTGEPPPPETPAVPSLQKVPSNPFVDHFHLLAERWTTPARQVLVSNGLDYMADLQASHGAALPVRSVTHGNEWDLYSASMSETSARVKRAVEKLRSAELLAALVSLKYPAFMDHHRGARDQAFQDLGLYWEHNWTADGPITRGQRAAWQNKLAASVEYHVDGLASDGLVRLGGMIARPEKADRFFVLNPLGWVRSDAADHALRALPASADIHVHDLAAGRDVPHQLLRVNNQPHLRIWAADVPAAGYKVYEIRPGRGSAAQDAAAVAAPALADGSRVLENAAVRLRLAPDGALLSLVDKLNGSVEMADTIDGLALNDLTGEGEKQRSAAVPVASPPLRPGAVIQIESAGPVSVTLHARSTAGLPRETWVTLYRQSGRVDIRNHITANFGDVRHWAFSFKQAQPRVKSEEVGAINLNRLQRDGGDYADSHSRYDHITVNHYADISDAAADGRGVTLSNPDLAFAQLGRSSVAQLDITTPQIKLLAGGQVDGRNLGIRQQNGAAFFLQRFGLLAHGGGVSNAASMRFALEHQNPLLAAPVLAGSSGVFPAHSFSLLQGEHPDVLLWALKPHDDGIAHGLVARWWNLTEAPAATRVRLTGALAGAVAATHVETDVEGRAAMSLSADGSLELRFKRQQLRTVRLLPLAPVAPAAQAGAASGKHKESLAGVRFAGP